MPKEVKKINLKEELTSQIKEVVLSYKKPEKIIIFGSRATHESTNTSDIDIAIMAKNWTSQDINLVHHLLEEKVKTALKIDVVNYYRVKKELQKNIEQGVTVYDQKD